MCNVEYTRDFVWNYDKGRKKFALRWCVLRSFWRCRYGYLVSVAGSFSNLIYNTRLVYFNASEMALAFAAGSASIKWCAIICIASCVLQVARVWACTLF